MAKRIVVAGGRNYNNYQEAREFIDACLAQLDEKDEIIIVSGGAQGADALGERYARENGFAVERYPADWKTYGRSAGPRRNQKMAELCDCVICFWDGQSKGTRSMISCAQKCHKPLWVKKI